MVKLAFKTLRQHIRTGPGISPQPWKHYRGEIQSLCVSAQCLFRNSGLPWDVLEMELRDEGYLGPDESLWEVMNTEAGLRRTPDGWAVPDDINENELTEEDYRANGYVTQPKNGKNGIPF